MQPWKLTRAYGCNSIIASENMLTFRSGAAGFYDLKRFRHRQPGRIQIGLHVEFGRRRRRFERARLHANLQLRLPEPDFVGLVHMPEIDMWSVDTSALVKSHGKRIESLASISVLPVIAAMAKEIVAGVSGRLG